MTKLEAVRELLSRIQIGARVVDVDYDPAGSSTTYKPQAKDLDVAETLIGRKITEADLWFECGGYIGARYTLRREVVDELQEL